MFRGAIFDMDGVLVDNMKAHRAAFEVISERYSVESQPQKAMQFCGMGNRDFFGALFPPEIVERVGWEKLADEVEAIYREIYAPELTPAQGLIPFLGDLKKNGVKVAVGTSACQENLDFVLDGLGIRHYFDAIVTADMVANTKPNPEIYLMALKKLDLPAEECFVFEDAVLGIQAARGAGIKSIALATSQPKALLEVTPGVALIINNFTSLNFRLLNGLI